MVRYATIEDIPTIVELAEKEHHLSLWSDTEFDAEATAETARHFITEFGHTLLVSEGGYFAGLLQPVGFNRRLMAIEFAWFAKDGQGLALLHRFHEWAVQMGAIAVVAHDYAHAGHLSQVLAKRYGYGPLGTAMVFRIDHRMADAEARAQQLEVIEQLCEGSPPALPQPETQGAQS